MRHRVAPMPPPGSDFDALARDAEPFGDIVDLPPLPTEESPQPPPSPPSGGTPPPVDGGGPPGDDEPPAHAKQERRTRQRRERDTGPRKLPRVTAGVRNDIEAKISFALEIPGRIWQARDPACGTVFVEQRPEIATAMTEIVCQSTDLIEWFTGTGGQFMLYLNLAAACWPVATMVLAHHVYHSVQLEQGAPQYGDATQPDYSRYAA